MRKIQVTTSGGETFECTEEQAEALRLLQRAIDSFAAGSCIGFLLLEVDEKGRTRTSTSSLNGEHLDKLADAAGEQRLELFHLAALWEGNAPLEARSIRKQ